MLEKYSHTFFDLDGTLVQTAEEYRYLVVPKALRKLGINRDFSCRAIDEFWLEGDRDVTIKREFCCDPSMFWEVFKAEDRIEERIKYTKAVEDAVETLTQLKAMGKGLAIITDSPAWISGPEVGLLPRHLFSLIFSIPTEGYEVKPDPESLKVCLQRLDTAPESVVYIGNSLVDLKYAENGGVDSVLVDREKHPFVTSLNGKRVQSLLELITRA